LSTLRIPTARIFEPLLAPARYKAAWGGRGSGKSRFFAGLMVEEHMRFPGHRSVCIRETQKSIKDSSKRLLEDTIGAYGVGKQFEILEREIRSRGGGIIIFTGLQDHTAESIKSLEGFNRAWVEEAQAISPRSWSLLRPTIRARESEIWCSWNPRLRTDAVDGFFRRQAQPGAAVVQANWRDNPWFPEVLEAERQRDLANNPDGYGHIWEGEYATVTTGAYYAKQLTEARAEGRIMPLARDPLLAIRTFHDIGGAGAKADAYAIWVAQFVGQKIMILDYYEAVGQVLASHVEWLRSRGYGNAEVVLPHDGVNTNNYTGKRYEDHWRDAGFSVRVIPNAGAGAASQRIEAARRLFPAMHFDEQATEAGRAALGWYHASIDEARGCDLGPAKDWSAHGADAFGLMAMAYEPPSPWLSGPCGPSARYVV
jgi:phage terminase large subunit